MSKPSSPSPSSRRGAYRRDEHRLKLGARVPALRLRLAGLDEPLVYAHLDAVERLTDRMQAARTRLIQAGGTWKLAREERIEAAGRCHKLLLHVRRAIHRQYEEDWEDDQDFSAEIGRRTELLLDGQTPTAIRRRPRDLARVCKNVADVLEKDPVEREAWGAKLGPDARQASLRLEAAIEAAAGAREDRDDARSALKGLRHHWDHTWDSADRFISGHLKLIGRPEMLRGGFSPIRYRKAGRRPKVLRGRLQPREGKEQGEG